jgi:SAM-dependent methyltransferase
MAAPIRLGRARDRIKRYLAPGCTRAVFAAPNREGEQAPAASREIAVQTDQANWFEHLFAAALEAAKEGLVKQTFVIDDARAIVVDARQGFPQERVLDSARAQKIMGGKDRIFHPEHSAALLRAIGLMNADGTISAKNAKKYKQVCHLAELALPILESLAKSAGQNRPLRIVDLACGNSYLTLIVAEVLRLRATQADILGIDRRSDVIARSQERARDLGFANLRFEVAQIGELLDRGDAEAPAIDLLLSLHACDTATDEALDFGLRKRAGAILCVPCCHAEVARQLEKRPAPIAALHQQGLLRRAYAEALTDAVRVEVLEACGYDVTTVEFVGSEHTPKNLMIRAQRRGKGKQAPWPIAQVEARCQELGILPQLLVRLGTQVS